MTPEQVDAVLARLRQYPEHQGAVEVIEALRAENGRLREAIKTHRADARKMGEGFPSGMEDWVITSADIDLWAALGESPVPDEPTAWDCAECRTTKPLRFAEVEYLMSGLCLRCLNGPLPTPLPPHRR